jgi:hypothetical protein
MSGGHVSGMVRPGLSAERVLGRGHGRANGRRLVGVSRNPRHRAAWTGEVQNDAVSDAEDEFDIPSTEDAPGPGASVRGFLWAVRHVGLPAMLKTGRALQKMYHDQTESEEDAPRNVTLNDRSRRIAHLAQSLARSGREDDNAVAEIQAAARNHRDDLRVAALYARQDGLHHESPVKNRTHRLLQAALNDTAVAPPDAADRARLELVARFENLPEDGQWAELVSREPRLAELEGDIRSGRAAHFMPSEELQDELRSGFKGLPDDHRRALTDWAAAAEVGRQRLEALVGPEAATDDALMHTTSALESAWGYLSSI